MPKQSGRKIITNRQLNFTLSPVDLHNPKEMPYSLSNYAIDGAWNHHHSIILDIILNEFIKKRYAEYKRFPGSWRNKKVFEVNVNSAGAYFAPSAISFLTQTPLDAFSTLEGYNVEEHEREQFAGYSFSPGNEISFEEHLKNQLKYNQKYQDFLIRMKELIPFYDEDLPFSFEILKLFENYPELDKYKYNLPEKLAEISKTKFKMTYEVKCMPEKAKIDETGRLINFDDLIGIEYSMDDFQEIVLLKIHDDKIVVNFKSPLGKMILHNTIILDTDWISEKALTLKNNAYFIYKKFIFNRVAGKNKAKEIILWYEDIKAGLDLKGKNNSGNYTIIEGAFGEMQKKGLMKGYTWRRIAKQRRYKLDF